MEETINDKIKRVLDSGTYEFSRKPSAVAREMGKPEEEALPQTPTVESPEPQPPVNEPVLPQETPAEQTLSTPVAIDGDTIRYNGKTYRLKGIDTPELKQVYGERSRASLERLLQNGEIEIEEVEKDKYGRTIAYVRVGGKDVGVQMVESGDAWHYELDQTDRTEALRQAQETARAEGRGLFGEAGSALTEPRSFRRGGMSDYERERWEQIRARTSSQMKDVWTPEAIKASVEESASRHSVGVERTKEQNAVNNIASAVAFIGGIGFQHEARGIDVENIPVYELNRVLHYMNQAFKYTAENFRNAGHADPYDAARKYVKSAMDIIRTEERKQKAFKNLSYEEQQEVLREAYGDRVYSIDEVRSYVESTTVKGAIELAFLNGATAETVSTAVMMALSEFQGEDEHRHRLAQMDIEQARKAVSLTGAIRAQYDGNFAAKGLISLWNSTEAVVNNFGAIVSGEAFGTASNERVLDLLAQQVEDTIIDNEDSFMGEVATVTGSSLPSMALLLVPKVGIPLYAANAYSDMSRVPVLEDWHNAEPWKVEAAKVTYALAAPWIEKFAMGLAMKPLSGAMKYMPSKLAGMVSTKTLSMKLASVQQHTAAAKISKGLVLAGHRSLISGLTEVPEEVATQVVSSAGGMFVDPTSADGRKLYNLGRLTDEAIEAAWMAIKTGPFMTAPFAGAGVLNEYYGLNSNLPVLDPKDRPNILEYQQQVINAHAAISSMTRAKTIGGLSDQEAATFYVADRATREKIMAETESDGKKQWLSEMDTYLRIREDYQTRQRETSPDEDVTTPEGGVELSGDRTKTLRDIAENPQDSSERIEVAEDEELASQREAEAQESVDGTQESAVEGETPASTAVPPAPAESDGETALFEQTMPEEVPEQEAAQPSRRQLYNIPEKPSKSGVRAATRERIAARQLPKNENGLPVVPVPSISNEINAAYGVSTPKSATLNPRLVEIFKGAIAEEEKTGVAIVDMLQDVFGLEVISNAINPNRQSDLRDDYVSWVEGMAAKLIEDAKRFKDGDQEAAMRLESMLPAYRKLSQEELQAKRDARARAIREGRTRAEEHPLLRKFAAFSKKWLRSVFGDKADIFIVDDMSKVVRFVEAREALEEGLRSSATNATLRGVEENATVIYEQIRDAFIGSKIQEKRNYRKGIAPFLTPVEVNEIRAMTKEEILAKLNAIVEEPKNEDLKKVVEIVAEHLGITEAQLRAASQLRKVEVVGQETKLPITRSQSKQIKGRPSNVFDNSQLNWWDYTQAEVGGLKDLDIIKLRHLIAAVTSIQTAKEATRRSEVVKKQEDLYNKLKEDLFNRRSEASKRGAETKAQNKFLEYAKKRTSPDSKNHFIEVAAQHMMYGLPMAVPFEFADAVVKRANAMMEDWKKNIPPHERSAGVSRRLAKHKKNLSAFLKKIREAKPGEDIRVEGRAYPIRDSADEPYAFGVDSTKRQYRLFKTKQGVTYAVLDMSTGMVYVSRKANPVKVLHEVFGHATWQWMKKNDPKGYKALVEEAKAAPKEIRDAVYRKYKDVYGKTIPSYEGIGVSAEMEAIFEEEFRNSDIYLDEVFAHLIEARFSDQIDTLFNTHEKRAWYVRFWDAVTKAVRKVWQAITGNKTDETPESLLDSLSKQFFGYGGIFAVDSPPSLDGKEVRFSVGDLTEDPDISSKSALEEMDERDFTVENDDEESVGSAYNASEVTVGSNFLMYARPSYLAPEDFSDYELRNTVSDFEDALVSVVSKLGLTYEEGLFDIRYPLREQRRTGRFENPWQRQIDSKLAALKGTEREVFKSLSDIARVFGADIDNARSWFTDELVEGWNKDLQDVKKLIADKLKPDSALSKKLLRQVDAVEYLVALATVNTDKYSAVRDILSQHIRNFRPPSSRIGVEDSDLLAGDRDAYGVEDFREISSSDSAEILREATFGAVMEDPIRTHVIAKTYKAVAQIKTEILDTLGDHENKYVREIINDWKETVRSAVETAEEEFAYHIDSAYMEILLSEGKGLTVAREKAFDPGRDRKTLWEQIHILMRDREIGKKAARENYQILKKTLKTGYEKIMSIPQAANRSLFDMVKLLMLDDAQKALGEKETPLMSDKERSELMKAINVRARITKFDRVGDDIASAIKDIEEGSELRAKMEEAKEEIESLRKDLVALQEEFVRGYKESIAKGEIYVESETYKQLTVARIKYSQAFDFFVGQKTFGSKRSADETLSALKQNVISLRELRDREIIEGSPRGPLELTEEISKVSTKIQNLDVWRKPRKEQEPSSEIKFRNMVNFAYREGLWESQEVIKNPEELRRFGLLSQELKRRIISNYEELAQFDEIPEGSGVFKRRGVTGFEYEAPIGKDGYRKWLSKRKDAPEALIEALKENKRKLRPLLAGEVVYDFVKPKKDPRFIKVDGKNVAISRVVGSVGMDWIGMLPEMTTKIKQEIENATFERVREYVKIRMLIKRSTQREGVVHSGYNPSNKDTGIRHSIEEEVVETPDTEVEASDAGVVNEYKKRTASNTMELAAVIVMYMLKNKKQDISKKELEDLAYTYNPYLGGVHLDHVRGTAYYLARLVNEQAGVEKMTDEEIVEACKTTLANMNADQFNQMFEMFGHIQSDEWKLEAEKYRAYQERLERTGRNLPFAPLSERELVQLNVLVSGKRSNLYKNKEGVDSQPRIGVNSFRDLNKRVSEYLFSGEPKRKDFETDEEYEQAVEDHKSWVKSPALISKYRDTLVWLYGKYAENEWLRRHFDVGTANTVKRLVAQMRDYADTRKQISTYAERIEDVLKRDRTTLTVQHYKRLVTEALSEFDKPYDPMRPLKSRKITPSAHAFLNSAYEAMSMTQEELNAKIEEADAEYFKHTKVPKKKVGDSAKKGKANTQKALVAYAKQGGYRMMLPFVKAKYLTNKETDSVRDIYDTILTTISEGGRAVEDHIERETKRIEDFVSKVLEILDRGKSGEVDKTAVNESLLTVLGDRAEALMADGFTLEQRLQELTRFVRNPDDKKALETLFNDFLNDPVVSAESNMKQYYRDSRKAFNDMVLRVYGDGAKSKDSDVVYLLAELNTAIDEFKKFSASGNKALTRAQLMAQLAMVTQDDVQVPLLELERKLQNGEVFWDKEAAMNSEVEDAEVLSEEERTMITRIRNIPEMVEALKKVSNGKDLRMVEALRDYYADLAPELDAVAVKITGAPITVGSEKYFPVFRSSEWATRGIDRSQHVIGSVPDYLTPRQNTTTDISEEADVFSIFNRQAEKNAHFMAFGGLHYRLTELFENKAWTRLTNRLLGENNSKLLKDHVQDVCAPHLLFVDNSGANAFWALARKVTSIILLGGNLLVGLKQTTSISAFAHEIGWRNLVSALLQNPFSPEMNEARKIIFESPEAKLRWGDSWVEIQSDLMSRPGKSPRVSVAFSRYMAIQRMGDLVPSFIAAPGVYLATYRRLLSSINPETNSVFTKEEAEVRAREIVFDMIEKTQQTSRVSNMGNFQRRGNALSQLWTQFQSSTILFFSSEVRAFRDVAAAPTKENWQKLAGNLISNHIIMPSLLKGAEMLARWVLEDEDPDEEDLKDLVAMILTGPLSGLVILGNLLYSPFEERNRDVTAPSVSFFGRVLKNVKNLGEHAVTGEADELSDDFLKLTKSLLPPVRDSLKLWDAYVDESDKD